MEFLASLPTFNKDHAAQTVFAWFRDQIDDPDAICFYKYPFVGVTGSPDLLFLSRRYQPIVIKCFDFEAQEVVQIADNGWDVVQGISTAFIDAPALTADDLAVDLRGRFERARHLRRRIAPVAVAALPRATESSIFNRFGLMQAGNYIWAGGEAVHNFITPLTPELNDEEWRLTRSVLQTAFPLTKNPGGARKGSDKLGGCNSNA